MVIERDMHTFTLVAPRPELSQPAPAPYFHAPMPHTQLVEHAFVSKPVETRPRRGG